MDKLKPMVDMSISPKEEAEKMSTMIGAPVAMPNQPRYPYGLSISLEKDSLEKLDVDTSDWKVGDVFHLHALAKLTRISQNENEHGEDCSVGLQITHLAGESEDEENQEYDAAHKAKNPYKKNHDGG